VETRAAPAERLLALALFGAAIALRAYHILAHFDLDWEPDSYEHLLMAKSAVAKGLPGFWTLLDPWAKPLFTTLAAAIWVVIPHAWPLIPVVQVANSVLWLATVALVANLARREADDPFAGLLVLALGLFSYVAFRDSVASLTEPSGAILVAAGLTAHAKRRPYLAVTLFGLACLARLDALLLVAVAVIGGSLEALRRQDLAATKILWRIVGLGAVGVAPVACWNLLGGLHSGNLRYVLGDYSAHGSPYGHGDPLYYLHAFALTDPLLVFLGLGAGVVAVVAGRSLPRTTRLAAVQALVYFAVISALWARGAVGLAGLLRYFVVAYPAFLLAGAVVASFALRPWKGWGTRAAAVALVLAVQGSELRRIFRPPVNEANEFTSLMPSDLGSYPFLQLRAWRAALAGKRVISDCPEVLYYLGVSRSIYEKPRLRQVCDPDLAGVFVFVPVWSDNLGTHRADFDGLKVLADLPPRILIFERP